MQDLGIAFQTAHDESAEFRGEILPVPSNDWLMKRNCSLSPRQVGWFYLSIFSFSTAIGLFFAWRGTWLVLPFTALELTGLGIALLMYARHATDYERVTLVDGMLVVETSSAAAVTRQKFNPRWVRVELGESSLALVSLRMGGQTVQVGCFLDPYRRRKFAQELASALRRL
ncbi:DUF2244 domain-containing protein [Cupriavidus respiraculi]|uniref:DUF2244 domain-containing protein n=1 Tax=Cupriavidus respiraculi TaxID=195930 RepID=A0ABN7YT13_9BURK|nr:DUF2244 domain-containing protein [Cupriavidus respiraculi]MBY4946146.1 DUF2244 domain-containing protein [Cupriavidus respiraculi]CAG9175241.1 hypothetical protein LMG21510_02820 [Cupriavidus respiraculi]